MSDHEYSDFPVSKAVLARQAAEEDREAPPGGAAVQRDPVDRVVSRAGDASCARAHAATFNRHAGPDRSAVGSLLRLQRQYGNRYVREVLRLARGTGGDTGAGASVERAIEGARGGGQGLDHKVRDRMEPSFGADFSGVRVHTDTRADSLSRSLSAMAFTTGQDIFFRQGAYNPGTSSGRELLAHELTHVVQQNGGNLQRKMTVSQPGDRHESEADRMARAVMQQEQEAAPQRTDRSSIARQDEEEEKPAQAKADESRVQRQTEAPEERDEEEGKLGMQPENGALSRQTEEEKEE
jgi:hypothetical protein